MFGSYTGRTDQPLGARACRRGGASRAPGGCRGGTLRLGTRVCFAVWKHTCVLHLQQSSRRPPLNHVLQKRIQSNQEPRIESATGRGARQVCVVSNEEFCPHSNLSESSHEGTLISLFHLSTMAHNSVACGGHTVCITAQGLPIDGR